jgi:hypothetical protein
MNSRILQVLTKSKRLPLSYLNSNQRLNSCSINQHLSSIDCLTHRDGEIILTVFFLINSPSYKSKVAFGFNVSQTARLSQRLIYFFKRTYLKFSKAHSFTVNQVGFLVEMVLLFSLIEPS